MNIQAKTQRTAAEQGLIDAFSALVSDLPGDTSVTAKRDRLMADFGDAGLPSRRVEAWHYTDLRTLLREVPNHLPGETASQLRPILDGSEVLPLLGGRYVEPRDIEGLKVGSFREALMNGWATASLDALRPDDAIGRINGAFVMDGYTLKLAADAAPEKTIELQSVQNGGQAHGRFRLEAEAGSRATFIERHAGGEAAGLTTSVTEIDVAEGAELVWVIVQERGGEDTHLGQLRAKLAKDANFKLYVINMGGKLVRQEVDIAVDGEGAHFDLRAINLLAGQSHTDITLTLGHSVPDTTSQEIVRNVVLDRARGAFQGQIRVSREAQKTDAQMACNSLLLSDDGEFDAKPELEIFADDVICAHGATVDDLDPVHLFYLAARGVPEKIASALLVKGFVEELLDELDDEALTDALKERVEDWLDAHV
ncbi:MAG: Fe-S cluster assembly protein SufD [Rhizobiales bacterium]|nr:Fe-S cluster assembly protein SufD [Hyphomicrobiales bacterium]